MRVNYRLGQVARRKRIHAGLSLIVIAQDAGVSQGTLTRFEQGDGWRRETNAIVAAYAAACGTTERALWLEAIEAEDA